MTTHPPSPSARRGPAARRRLLREEQLRDGRGVRFDRHGELRDDRARRARPELAAEHAPLADLSPQAVALARGEGTQALYDDRAALRVEVEGDRTVRPAGPGER